jgi:putative tricarboxylic transport membrane protein
MDDKRARLPGERIFTLLLVAFAGLAFWQAFEISGFASLSGAGVFPMLAAGTMLVSGLIVVRQSWNRRAAGDEDREGGGEGGGAAGFARRITPLPIVLTTALIAGYMLALQPLGFPVATFAFLLAAILYLYRRGPLRSLAIAAGSLLVVWLVFRKVFTVVLPSGSVWPQALVDGLSAWTAW